MAASLGLAVVALAYRESVAGIVVAMLLWYGMVERRERLRERETQILAGVHIALLVVYLLLTGILDPDGGRPLIDADQDVFKNWWFYAGEASCPWGRRAGLARLRAIHRYRGPDRGGSYRSASEAVAGAGVEPRLLCFARPIRGVQPRPR
ncbi:hypothetical protein [Candidatus Amarobacter glycogenicus]|uniref:hypothetical protein n=1 Tax=Candidatus Amarobacter glycogenicus TaxID=3140699 RepID=UPI003136F242|nr:hypothetical protein [Dehalococcoidia bacterium]